MRLLLPTDKITLLQYQVGARGGVVGCGTALQGGRSRVRSPIVSLELFFDLVHPAALRPWGRLSL